MKPKLIMHLLVVSIILCAMAVSAFAAETPITFDGFTGAGFAPEPAAGQLDSDIWRVTGLSDGDGTFGGTHTTGDFARGSSTGGVTTGGVYAFTDVSAAGNTVLGLQPGGSDFTPGKITLKLQNTTGTTIADVYIAYKIWTLNDQARSNALNFAYSTDDASYTPVSILDYTTPEVADTTPSWTGVDRSTTLTGVNLAPGAFLYLQWLGNDVGGSGNRDEYGIDDVEVRIGGPTAISLRTLTATGASGSTALPALGLLAFGGVALYRRRRG